MKIYCILFDAVHHNEQIKRFLIDNGFLYRPCVTNSFTTTSLVSLFSGLIPSQVYKLGIGYGSIYASLDHVEKNKWDSKIILNNLPDDWTFHYHADKHNINFLQNECFSLKGNFIKYEHRNYDSEKELFNKMRDIPSNKNSIIFIKYNHLHEAYDCHSENFRKNNKANNQFMNLLNNMKFDEPNSLFWFFGDHGNWAFIDEYMTPPHSTICWSAIKNNIKSVEDSRKVAHITDFAHYLNHLIFNKELKLMDKFYYSEDGRAAIDRSQTTSFSVLSELEPEVLYQLCYHAVSKKFKFFRFNYEKQLKIEFDNNVEKKQVAMLHKKLYEVYGDRIKNFR